MSRSILAPSSAVSNEIATPSSRRRVDGVEVDAAIQDERAAKLISRRKDISPSAMRPSSA